MATLAVPLVATRAALSRERVMSPMMLKRLIGRLRNRKIQAALLVAAVLGASLAGLDHLGIADSAQLLEPLLVILLLF